MARRMDEIDPAVLQRAAAAKPDVVPVVGRRAFEAEVLESNLPVVVDFWAPWCQPCLKLSEALSALAPLYAGKLKFVKVNLSDPVNATLGERYEITSIPRLLPFMAGQTLEGEELEGLCSRKLLAAWLDRLVR